MKINCTLKELLMIVRSCEYTRSQGECSNCPFDVLADEDENCEGIETVCDIEVINGNQEDR